MLLSVSNSTLTLHCRPRENLLLQHRYIYPYFCWDLFRCISNLSVPSYFLTLPGLGVGRCLKGQRWYNLSIENIEPPTSSDLYTCIASNETIFQSDLLKGLPLGQTQPYLTSHPPASPPLKIFLGVLASLYFTFLIFQVKDGTILALKTLNLRPQATSTLA